MGTIVARTRKDGTTGYSAQIVLKRYAHIRQRGDRLAGWKWFAVASIPAQMVTGSTVTHVRAVETLHGTARGDIDANKARGYPRCRRKGEPPVSQGEE